jgi:hypothetical protein
MVYFQITDCQVFGGKSWLVFGGEAKGGCLRFSA